MDTRISLPPDLAVLAERESAARGISLADFVRQSLELAVAKDRSEDALFADNAVYCEEAPNNTAADHDDYLYGDGS